MSNNEKHVAVSLSGLFGILPLVIAWTFLASIGACGNSCQSCTNNGLHNAHNAISGN